MKARIGVTALALLLSGCFSLDSALEKVKVMSTPSSASRPKMATLPEFEPTVTLTERWQVNTGSAANLEFSPAVVGPVVNSAAADGSVVRVESGQQSWKIRVYGETLSGGVGADAQHVAVGTPKGEVLVFDKAGALMWRALLTSEVLSAPVFTGSMVIVRSGDNRINAFDSASGKQVWTYQRPIPALSLRSAVSVTVDGNVVYAGFPGGKLMALSLANGAPIWEATVAFPRGLTELDRIADVTSEPVVMGRQVCAAAFQGRVACFDLGSGELLWARDVSSGKGLDMDRGHVYVTDEKGSVLALDKDTGATLWKQDKLIGRRTSRPLSLGNYVVVGDVLGQIIVLSKKDGSFAARAATDTSAINVQPKASEGGFVVQTQRGRMYSMFIGDLPPSEGKGLTTPNNALGAMESR